MRDRQNRVASHAKAMVPTRQEQARPDGERLREQCAHRPLVLNTIGQVRHQQMCPVEPLQQCIGVGGRSVG